MKIIKRMLSIGLVIVLMLSSIPITSLPAMGATVEDNSLDYGSGGVITRAQWLHNLAEVFEMTVEEESFPDNYFSDLDSEHKYYNDILLNVEFGVIDIEAGENLFPDEAATRDFAAGTLNYCLGFQLAADTQYSFSDSALCIYPDDAQTAIDRGWIELVDGKFMPELNITSEEAEIMLQDALEVVGRQTVDADYDSTYSFVDGVIEIPDGTIVEEDENGNICITDCPEAIKTGDKFAVYFNGIPGVYEALNVSVKDNITVVKTASVEADEAFSDIDAQGVVGADAMEIIPADGVEVALEDDSSISTFSIKKMKNITAEVPVKFGGITGKVSVKIKNPYVDYYVDTGRVYVALCGDTEVKYSISASLAEAAGMSKGLTLFTCNIMGIGSFDITINVDFSGSASGVVTGWLVAGVECENGGGIRAVKSFTQKECYTNVEAETYVKLRASLGVTKLPVVSAFIYAEIGMKANFSKKTYTDEKSPHVCTHFAAYLFARYGASASANFGFWKVSESLDYVIFDESNSPVRIVNHYEDGKLVSKCTRGTTYSKFFTKASSRWSGSGWSSSNGAYALNANGTYFSLYDYTLNEDNEATITKYNGNSWSVYIPKEIDGYTVVAIGSKAFQNKKLSNVVIPDTVTSIGNRAFASCTGLSSINLPGSLNSIGYDAFYNCDSLRKINIPKSLETANYYDYYTPGVVYYTPFRDCDNLKTVEFEEGITSIISNLFWQCTGLEKIEIPDTVTKIGANAFRECLGLTEVSIPDTVISIGNRAFANCTGLSSINLPGSLNSIGYDAFYNCDSLGKINIPKSLETASYDSYYSPGVTYYTPFRDCDNLKTVEFEEGITSIISNLFWQCTGLEKIEIPDTVTKIGANAFRECLGLTEVSIPDTVISIGNRAFSSCTGLSSINLPGSLNSIGYDAFYNCDSLEKINIPKSLETASYDIYYTPGAVYYTPFRNCDNLKTVEFEEGITSIIPNLFWQCTGLEKVEIPDTVTKIGANAFRECLRLSEVSIPNKVTEIESFAFFDCQNLKHISLSNNLQSIEASAFKNCSKLESMIIPDSVVSMGESIFRGCASLKTVKLPNTRENIMSYTFADCSSLEKIEFPSTVKTVKDNAFLNCTSLKEVVFNNGLETIKDNAFKNCDALTIVNIPDSVNSISNSVFYDCDALETIVIPDSVTSMGSSMFYDCDALKNVTIGNSVTSINERMFEHCDVLESVVFPYRTETIGNYVFKDCVKFTSVTIPRATTSISTNAFSYPAKLTIYGVAGTYAETYANEIGATFVDKQVNATKVTLNKTEVTLNKGQSDKLIMTVTPSDFTDAVSWKSSDTNIATIAEDGTLVTKNVGTATIKVTVGNASASCKVTVVQPVTSVNINKSSVTLQAHDTYELILSVNPDNAVNKAVKWSSSAEDIASVDENGLVTAHKKGEATIKAEALDGSGRYDTCKITVSNNGVIAENISQLESPHNYSVNCKDFWQYTLKGADSIQVTFDAKTNMEDGFDYLYIYDGDGKEVGKYTGTELAGKTITVNDDTVRIQLSSDDAGTEWGFKVTDVKAASAHSHSYTSEVTKAATCSAEGVKTFTCSCGDSYTEKIAVDANAHSWDGGKVTTTATCKVSGVKTYTCQHNASHKKTENLGVNASTHASTKNVAEVKATCTEKGYTAGVFCNDCQKYISGHNEIAVDANAHSWDGGKVTTAATCKVSGVKTYTCQHNASHKKTENLGVNASNHANTKNVAEVKATCTVKGYTAGVFCNDCQKYISGHKEIAINASNHVNTKNVAEVKPTAENVGYTAGVYCNDCKKYISGHSEIPKIAASFTDSENAKKDGNNVLVNQGLSSKELLSQAGKNAVIKDTEGNVLAADKLPGTGMTIILADGKKYVIVVFGDIDGSGTVTAADARLTLRASVGLENYQDGSAQHKAANVESKDKLSAADARLILRASVGLENPKSWMK